jgi:hypothetical protein
MLDYFYGFDYEINLDSSDGSKELEIHASVYGIGEKYDATDLKVLAAKKFGLAAPKVTEPYDGLLQAIRLTYSLTPSSDRMLRDIVISLWLIVAADVVEQRKDDVEILMRENPDFPLDLSMRLAPLCSKSGPEGRCPCGGQVYGYGRRIFQAGCHTCKRSAKEVKELVMRPDVKLKPFW